MSSDWPAADATPTTEAPLLAGRYQLLEKLGQGGMGTVFRARDANLERPVAIKMLPEGSAPDADAVARFRREARALARLSHPGIIQAHDSGEEAGRPFLVMELVEGLSLARELADKGRIPPTRAADYGQQAALALHHAHQHRLIHRDVKPSNLLLSADGRVRLLDLGLARFLLDQIGEAQLTRTGTGMGTPDYCAPEQFRDAHKADARSDVYALGCTLYHLIAGRVPFPGSSFSEKVEAHETKEASPLEELCPEVPVGLALAVRRMMAKCPADRFASMAEVAGALTPYVAGSSASSRQIRNTSTWTGAQLVTMTALPRRRRLVALALAGAAMAVLLLAGVVGIVGFMVGAFRPDAAQVAQLPHSQPEGAPKTDTPGDMPKAPAKADDPNVLTVSQKKEDGGKYRTINEALAEVKPGQTIRVLDSGTYAEALALTRASQYSAVTLEAPRRATLSIPGGTHVGVQIINVPGLVLSGFRVRADGAVRGLIAVAGQVTGVTLEDLDLHLPAGQNCTGVSLESLRPEPGKPPVSVRHCSFRGGDIGLRLSGVPDPSTGVVIRENMFTGTSRALMVLGEVSRVCVVANRFLGASDCALHMGTVDEKTDGLLLANNSFLECKIALRLADTAPKGKRVRFANNLVLGAGQLDMRFVEWTGKADDPGKPGDGKAVARSWRIDHNWREVKEPPAADSFARGWVPPDPKNGDVRQDEIKGVSRDPKSPEFLRPARDSPLATEGAGNEDPSLPRYVGALPPEELDPWDWDRTWRMPKDAQLLTVSKESSGGGKYRTINDALKDAKPWATIRVLDSATYWEGITLDQKEVHEGLSLEAPGRATILLANSARQALLIRDVAHVRIVGLRVVEAEGSKGQLTRCLAQVQGVCPGVRLQRLELRPASASTVAVSLQEVTGSVDQPVCVERCRVEGASLGEGIVVSGSRLASAEPSRYLALRDNRVATVLRGIHLQWSLSDVQVTGNLICQCAQEAIGIQNLPSAAGRLLLANNTLFDSACGVRGWLDSSYELKAGQCDVCNNLTLQNAVADMTVCVSQDGALGWPSQDKAKAAGDLWTFACNWRDLSGTRPVVPLGRRDRKLDSDVRLQRNPSQPNFLRAPADSLLAAGGAGKDDPSLPNYVGALPPEGAEAWDWDRTWRSRVKMTGKKE
jgi:nitrous oxidase accessory protein NosD